MRKIFKTAIVGGGASGLLCAVELLSDGFCGEDVLILERNDRVGKKLIATGNGQGNLTNDNLGKQFFYGDDEFIASFIENANNVNLKEYFYRLGIPLTSTKDGKVYPLSKQASAVLDVIRGYLEYKGCQILTAQKVEEIKTCECGFEVLTASDKFFAKSVVLATGGAASKQFGTDGTAYSLVKKFGHERTAIYPSLVQLKTETDKIRGLKGLKETAKVTALVEGKPIKSATGDLLFTDYGVSGNAIFQISSCIADKKNAELLVEFLPELTKEQVKQILIDKQSKPFVKREDAFVGVLNKRIGQAVIKTAKSQSYAHLADALKGFRLKVTGSLDFNYAQVTKGGIKTELIDKETYQSKLAKNLYIVGEALDVDGDCGGYNLTIAFVTGIVAGRAIKKTLL